MASKSAWKSLTKTVTGQRPDQSEPGQQQKKTIAPKFSNLQIGWARAAAKVIKKHGLQKGVTDDMVKELENASQDFSGTADQAD